MSVQRSVSQQNASTLAQIRLLSSRVDALSPELAWLPGLLHAHHLHPAEGALVALTETPEQEGQHFRGTWLTASRRFWDFAVMVSRDYRCILEVEGFDDVTEQTVVSGHVPGTGTSFGYLARQVLDERAEG